MIPMKKESKTICFNDFTQAVPYSNDTAVGLFVTSLERNGDGESLGVLIVIMQLAPAGFHAMLDDIRNCKTECKISVCRIKKIGISWEVLYK